MIALNAVSIEPTLYRKQLMVGWVTSQL